MRVFYYVYSEKSIVAASEQLNVTQSAVSQSIQKLEGELKSPLFTRLHKKLVPTSAADRLFEIVESFMKDINTYTRELSQAKEYPFGEIRIGSPPEFGKTYLSSILADFRNKYGEVTFSLKFGTPEKLLPLLREGLIDFVLIDEFLTNKGYGGEIDSLHFEPLAKEEVILACSKIYYDNRIKGDCSLKSLLEQDYISYTDDMKLVRKWFENNFPKRKVKLNRILTVDNHEAIASSILHDLGLGVMASHLVKNEIDSGRMIAVKTGSEEIINTISLVQLMDKVPTLTERVFTGYLVEAVQSMLKEEEIK